MDAKTKGKRIKYDMYFHLQSFYVIKFANCESVVPLKNDHKPSEKCGVFPTTVFTL